MPLPAFFVVLFLWCALLPGALALLLFRSYRAANIVEWLLAAITLGILGIGWVALVLAELGLFSLLTLGGFGLSRWLCWCGSSFASALRGVEWLVAGWQAELTEPDCVSMLAPQVGTRRVGCLAHRGRCPFLSAP